jgi:hypothetical protein
MRIRAIGVVVGIVGLSLVGGGVWAGQEAGTATKPTTGLATVVIQVVDPSGARIPGAQVRVAPLPEKAPETMKADAKGELRLELKAGGYGVYVTSQGFMPLVTHMDVKGTGGVETFPVKLSIGRGGGVAVEETPGTRDWLAVSVYPFPDEFRVQAADLKAMARKTVTVHNAHSNADETYEGVEVEELLRKYGAPLGKELHGSALAYYLVATGLDGYAAVLSLGEVDTSFHPGDVIVADTMNGKALDARNGPFKLVVTEDKRPARWVRNLVGLQVKAGQ